MARRAMRAGADAINWRNHLPTGTPMLFNVAQLSARKSAQAAAMTWSRRRRPMPGGSS